MQRPSNRLIGKYNLLETFLKYGINSILNLQEPGEVIFYLFSIRIAQMASTQWLDSAMTRNCFLIKISGTKISIGKIWQQQHSNRWWKLWMYLLAVFYKEEAKYLCIVMLDEVERLWPFVLGWFTTIEWQLSKQLTLQLRSGRESWRKLPRETF